MRIKGLVFDIQRWSIHDGYGIRTNVFLKGCPLRCQWCSNPESQRLTPELAFFPDKCIRCGRCERNCPRRAIRLTEAGHRVDRSICAAACYQGKGDFECTKECYARALKVMGEETSAEDVMREVLSDKGIYETSGGGVTFTGGEPFAQPEFLMELLRLSKENGLHTTIETCACARWEDIERALPYLDFLFVDLKILDPEKHEAYTGAPNALVLENLIRINGYLRSHSATLAIRMPVIPGVNDAPEDVERTARWIREHLSEVNIFQLLPYHRLGRGKYENIGQTCPFEEAAPPDEARMEALAAIVWGQGLQSTYEQGGLL